ncbi:hypothetical protein NPS01_07690 [Nocardioides psychrotolerans]|uniref:Uncharacterized protein n=1 Tax=Nocardioides psychrotolerans TaxID=1005945 RepID=A0A1I3DA98_9ACTN|nr:hypothetical protein [Nocardioides psychrotolerans]GEP37106.1 hypothetical protein NPS01_07690 [Nocardioides psychrotolerans]SFH83657.1 hypothetical protein SAMN05216561_102419 [Nocardioides psychrotolerans]
MVQQPRSLVLAVRLLLALVVLGALVTLLTAVQREALIRAWSVGHPSDSSIQAPAFVPVAVVLYVVYAGLMLVLLPFLRGGYSWARWSQFALVAIIVISTLAALRTEPPTLFVVCSVASLPLDAAILYLLVHRDTSAFLRGEPTPARV